MKDDNTSAEEKAFFTFLIVAGYIILWWHVSLVVATPGHPITALQESLNALFTSPLHPATTPYEARLPWLIPMLVLGVALPVWWLLRRPRGKKSRPGFASPKEIAKTVAHGYGDDGQTIGYAGGKRIVGRLEDTGLLIAPPRSGKTVRRVIPSVLEAPGACVSTSTKSDVLWVTHAARRKMGRVLVFDPERVSSWPKEEKVTWNMVSGCEDSHEAAERAQAMVKARPMDGASNSAFFSGTAETVLRVLLHAAALGGCTMREVLRWATNFGDDAPFIILDNHPDAHPGWREALEVYTRGKAKETSSSTQMALGLVLAPLATGPAMASVLPSGNEVDVRTFITSTDTLYLMSQSGTGLAAPVTTALVAAIDRQARLASQQTKNGRLDVPLTLVLDEVANIAAIPSLPSLMTDGGGRGVIVWAIAQSMSQLETRWDREGAQTLLNGAAIKLILGGLSEHDFLDQMTRLMGEHRVQRATHSYGHGPSSRSVSEEWQRVMRPEELRELPTGKALLMYRNAKPTIIDLPAWWERKDAKQLKAAIEEARVKEGVA